MSMIWVRDEKPIDPKEDPRLVQANFWDMPLHMKHSAMEITEKVWHQKSDAGDRAEAIKKQMDQMYGGKWAVMIGEFAFFVSHSKLLRLHVQGKTVVIFLPLLE